VPETSLVEFGDPTGGVTAVGLLDTVKRVVSCRSFLAKKFTFLIGDNRMVGGVGRVAVWYGLSVLAAWFVIDGILSRWMAESRTTQRQGAPLAEVRLNHAVLAVNEILRTSFRFFPSLTAMCVSLAKLVTTTSDRHTTTFAHG
jgi:hypothetical protein